MQIDTQVLRTIPPGEVFMYNGVLYLRTDSNELRAVSLQTGELERLHEDACVVPIFDAHVRVS